MILFLGVAGSGKSVQGRILADKMGLPWLSTGEFLRMLLSGEDRKRMTTGELIGDDKIIKLVQKILHLIDSDNEFVLDGFPRSEKQVDWLLNQVDHGQLKVTAALHIEVDEEEVKRRLAVRGRADDHEKAINERLYEYNKVISPMLDQLRKGRVPVIDIDGGQSVDKVHKDIVDTLGPLVTKA